MTPREILVQQLARVALEERIEEAKWWRDNMVEFEDGGAWYVAQERIANLERQLEP